MAATIDTQQYGWPEVPLDCISGFRKHLGWDARELSESVEFSAIDGGWAFLLFAGPQGGKLEIRSQDSEDVSPAVYNVTPGDALRILSRPPAGIVEGQSFWPAALPNASPAGRPSVFHGRQFVSAADVVEGLPCYEERLQEVQSNLEMGWLGRGVSEVCVSLQQFRRLMRPGEHGGHGLQKHLFDFRTAFPRSSEIEVSLLSDAQKESGLRH